MPKPLNKEKDAIVAFRIADERRINLEDRVTELRIVGVLSHHQLARKLVLDFLDGKLVYLQKDHKFQPPS